MGFDLHGLNPKAETPRPEWTKGEVTIETSKDNFTIDPQIKEEYDDFIKRKLAWEDETSGSYFRNNVWFWRPLWTFVCSNCDDFLTDEDARGGSCNNGYTIGKTKAKKIAQRLRKLLKNGEVSAYKAMYDRHIDKLSDNSFDKHYPFTIENVKRFERFCELSGGFDIC
jgi:hypothetical protein